MDVLCPHAVVRTVRAANTVLFRLLLFPFFYFLICFLISVMYYRPTVVDLFANFQLYYDCTSNERCGKMLQMLLQTL